MFLIFFIANIWRRSGLFRPARRLGCWAVLAAAGLLPVAHASKPMPCPQGGAVVVGATPQDFADVCQGAAAATGFFASHGERSAEPVLIEVTTPLPAEAGPTAVGCYIEKKRTAYVVPYATFRKHRTWFGVPISRAMYRALASHEAAHALAGCHFRTPHPTLRAKEYLAYVAMWSSMPPALRSEAMRQMRPEGYDSLDRLTPMLYLFDPMRFGAEAYRHFITSPDPTGLIQDILSGQALND